MINWGFTIGVYMCGFGCGMFCWYVVLRYADNRNDKADDGNDEATKPLPFLAGKGNTEADKTR